MKRIALVIIGHFKPEWNDLSEESQAAFAARVGRTARKVGVTPVIGYKLTTQGSFLQIYEANDKKTLERFMGELDALGYKKYYDQALMVGERAENWIATEANPGGTTETSPAGTSQSSSREERSSARATDPGRRSPPDEPNLEPAAQTHPARKKTETSRRTR